VRALRERFPGVPVVTHVNTYADVKAESDVCCTSGNASRVVSSLGVERVIFLPDEHLARNVARETGKRVIFPTRTPRPADGAELDHEMIGWQGRCEVNGKLTPEDIANIRRQFPDVVVLAHPECSPEVVAASDFSGSTAAMIDYVKRTRAPRYLLLTECSMGDRIAAANSAKVMLRLCNVRRPHMNEITLEQTLAALEQTRFVVDVPEDVRRRAQRAVQRMIEVS
jgi:quinolinate synthase